MSFQRFETASAHMADVRSALRALQLAGAPRRLKLAVVSGRPATYDVYRLAETEAAELGIEARAFQRMDWLGP